MKKRQAETEYLYGSARVRALENRLVGRERINQLLESKSVAEMMNRLTEYGVTMSEGTTGKSLTEAREDMLLHLLKTAYDEVEEAAPCAEVFTYFRYPYDCNNLKLAMKASLRSLPESEVRGMMFDFGTVPVDAVLAAVAEHAYACFPEAMAHAARTAEEDFARSGDPQMIDAALDRACYADMLTAAAASGEDVLVHWVRTRVDLTNLVICLRLLRMERGEVGRMFLENTLLTGGTWDVERLLQVYDDAVAGGEETFWAALSASAYASFAHAVEATEKSLAEVEKCADDAYMAVVREGARQPFGAAVLAGYLVGWETAVKNIRILLAAKQAMWDVSLIRQRVRESYV